MAETILFLALNNTAGGNAFFGSGAGSGNTIGGTNSFFGLIAGQNNTTGSDNTMIGFNANPASADLNFATAIGSGSTVLSSNTIALGRSSGADIVVLYGLGTGGIQPLCRNALYQMSTCGSGLYNSKSEIEAVNELRKENEELKKEVESQESEIAALHQALCRLAPMDKICKKESK